MDKRADESFVQEDNGAAENNVTLDELIGPNSFK